MNTVNQINKQNPGTYVMVSRQFGEPVFIGNPTLENITPVIEISEAQRWSYADTLSSKLNYHRNVSGLNLEWEKL